MSKEGLAQQQGLHLKLPQLQRCWPDFKGPAFAVQLSTTLGLVDLRLGLSIYPTTATRTSTKHELPSKLDSILALSTLFWGVAQPQKRLKNWHFLPCRIDARAWCQSVLLSTWWYLGFLESFPSPFLTMMLLWKTFAIKCNKRKKNLIIKDRAWHQKEKHYY